MSLLKRIGQTILLWGLVMLFIILVALIPRETDVSMNGHTIQAGYEFSWEIYSERTKGYFAWMWENKSFGDSKFNRSVEEEIKIHFPRSLKIIGLAFFLAVSLGVVKGIYDYKTMHTRKSFLGNGTTWVFQSLPDFFVILVVQAVVISLMLKGFPTISLYGHDSKTSFLLPSILVSIYPMFYIARITSAALAGQERELYIQTAKAKGLTEYIILFKHVLTNCWANILSNFSAMMAFMLSNLLIVEYLMYYKGAAYRLYEAFGLDQSPNIFRVNQQPVYEGTVIIGFFVCFIIIIAATHVISDIAKHTIDPRWRKEA